MPEMRVNLRYKRSDDYDFDTLIDVGRNGLTRLSFTASVNDNDDDFLE